jgi:phage portal protein BeeE
MSGARSGLRKAADYAWLLGDWIAGPAAAPATEAEAMALPPFGRAVELITNAVAATGWHAEKWDADLGVSVRVPDQPAVLTDPYPNVTPWHYKWSAAEDLVLFGNSFGLFGPLDFRTGRPGWVAPVRADEVWIMTDPARPWAFQWAIGGTLFDPDEVLHISAGNRSGEMLGRGTLNQYGGWLGGSVAAEDHASSYFAGGALPPAVITANQVITQGQADELKSKWRLMTSTREPVVLPSGVTLTPIVSDAVAAQLVESRQWNAQMCANVVGVPGWKLGLPGPTMTYQNVESADIDFVRDSVDRYAQPLAEAFTKWLMPRGWSVAWDYAARMRADAKSTEEVITGYHAAGIIDTAEARRWINRPPLPQQDDPAA